jgi:hypothetical protein
MSPGGLFSVGTGDSVGIGASEGFGDSAGLGDPVGARDPLGPMPDIAELLPPPQAVNKIAAAKAAAIRKRALRAMWIVSFRAGLDPVVRARP